MAKLDFWSFMVIKDDILLSFINFISNYRFLNPRFVIRFFETKNQFSKLKQLNNSKEVFIILNGPSLKDQKLYKLDGKELIFVNRGFLHKDYKLLKPKYHIFIDSKMVQGIWSTKWFDDILEMVPSITFVLPSHWADLEMFKFIKERQISVIWLPLLGVRGTGVSGAAINISLSLGYKKIFFTGFDASGFVNELSKKSSHFYGFIDDKDFLTANSLMKGYYMNARQIRELILLSRKGKKKNIDIINLTNGGLLNMFDREDFNNVVNSK